MIPRKLNVLFAFPSYGGNGGFASEHPAVREWFAKALIWCKNDPRVGETWHRMIADTPIPMVRNRFVEIARQVGADILVMCDSDQVPDVLVGEDPDAKPFFETAFNFLYANYDRGPNVAGSPYCGPPVSQENVYVFRWAQDFTDAADDSFRLAPFTREEAASKTGIEAVGALPTGLIMVDMRAFNLIKPPYHYYEWKDDFQAEKSSTEDVTVTRDIGLACQEQLGYNPIHVLWDCWAGHVKPKVVSKPKMIFADYVADKLVDARKRLKSTDKVLEVGAQGFVPKRTQLVPTKVEQVVEAPAQNTPSLNFVNAHHQTMPQDLDVLRKLVRSLGGRPDFANQASPRFVDVVEVGSWAGQSAIAMADSGAHVTCVDHWRGNEHDRLGRQADAMGGDNVYEAFLRNAGSRLNTSITPLRMDSLSAANAFKDVERQLDMVFIDAGHEYEDVKADILAWLPLVANGGILSGHDYCDVFPGVKRAVQEFFGLSSFNIEGSVWWVRVTEALKETALPSQVVVEDQPVVNQEPQSEQPEIPVKHWHPIKEVEQFVASKCGGLFVVDIGANESHAFSRANTSCGRETAHPCDFISGELPFTGQSVGFAYCRHVIEDLSDPTNLLKEIVRVARAGYIECPSPVAELTRNVVSVMRGYSHHEWIVWSEDGVLNLIRKHPMVELLVTPDYSGLLNESPLHWNTYHLWEGELKFKVWRHEMDYDISNPQSYADILTRAAEAGKRNADQMELNISRLNGHDHTHVLGGGDPGMIGQHDHVAMIAASRGRFNAVDEEQ